jgi:hypothetical protein
MMRYVKLAGFIAALLVVFLSSFTLAQEFKFSISPAEVHIDDLPPGETSEFELTIHNKEELAHNFTLTTFQPPEEERREGRAEFPDDSWISFSSPDIEVMANSEARVTVTITIPPEPTWAGKEWETWLGVTAESRDILAVRLYTRLLVSTTPELGARPNAGSVVGIVVGMILLGFGGYYYYRRRARSKRF